MTLDYINAIFEAAGVIFALYNCHVLTKHKAVQGVSILTTVFFTVWGGWNIHYYGSLEQPASMVAAAGLLMANSLWLSLWAYYTRRAA